MKVGKVIKANEKGQIVIPKEYRDRFGIRSDVSLHIVPQKGGLLLYPIVDVVPDLEEQTFDRDRFLKILDETRGAWAETEDWEEWGRREKAQRKLELKATRRGKKKW